MSEKENDQSENWKSNIEEDREIFIEFLKEAKFRIEDIEAGIMDLEDNPDDAEIVNRLFRQFHSIKGSAGLLDITSINALGHEIESLLEDVREGKKPVTSEFIDFLLNSMDTLKILVQNVSDEVDKS